MVQRIETIRPSRLPLLTFALIAAAVYAAALTLLRLRPALHHPDVVAAGVLTDLLLTVPLAFYLLAVRRAGWPVRTLIPLFLASLTGAALLVPEHRVTLLRVAEILSAPVEIGLVAWIAFRVRRSLRGTRGADDPLERLRAVAFDILPARRVAEAVAFEMAVIYYALLARRRGEDQGPAGARSFTYHLKSGYGAILGALAMVIVAETVPVHLLLARWSPRVAWTLTVLGLYSLVWLIADFRATRLRPIVADERSLHLRCGLRWSVTVPRERIVAVHERAPKSEPVLRLTLPMARPLWLELDAPVTADGPYGLQRQARWIAVAVDDTRAFREMLNL
jgi:hypothetical protein